MHVASQLVEDYLRRTGKPRVGQLDAPYAYQWAVLRDLLSRLEVILDDENIPHETAERVLRCLLYGSPSPADAELRIAQDERLREALARAAPIPVDKILGLPPR